MILIDDVLGVALFDLNGLPCAYFITDENPSTAWVQIVFQALGLRSLLASSLKMEGFQQITVNLTAATAIVVRRKQDYMALLLKSTLNLSDRATSEALNHWISTIDPSILQNQPRFRAP